MANSTQQSSLKVYLRLLKYVVPYSGLFAISIFGFLIFASTQPMLGYMLKFFVDGLNNKITYYSLRHSVKPGLTGWAQLRYPYGSSEEDASMKLTYDLFYVKNHSLRFDMMIFIQTIEVVLFGRGAR